MKVKELLKPSRQKDESYKQYVKRRTAANAYIRVMLKGRTFWPAHKGTYVRKTSTAV